MYVCIHVTCNMWRPEFDLGILFLLLSTLYIEEGLLFEPWLVDSSSLTRQLTWRTSSPSPPSKGWDYRCMPLSLVFMSVLGLELNSHCVASLYLLSNLASPQTCSLLTYTEPMVIRKHNSIIRYGQRNSDYLKYHHACVHIFVDICAYIAHTHTHTEANDFVLVSMMDSRHQGRALTLQKASHFLGLCLALAYKCSMWSCPANLSSTELDQRSVSGLNMYMYVNKSKTWNPKISNPPKISILSS